MAQQIELYDYEEQEGAEDAMGHGFDSYEELLEWLLKEKLSYAVVDESEKLDTLEAIASAYHGFSFTTASDRGLKSALIRVLAVTASAQIESAKQLALNNKIMAQFLDPLGGTDQP